MSKWNTVMLEKLCSLFARTASRDEHNLLELARVRQERGRERPCWVPITVETR